MQAIELVGKAAEAPALGRWRVLVVEDADRMTEAAANALLKAIEEPTERTVWILCAPSSEDLLATIRSRTRHVSLRIPAADAIAQSLVSEGVDPAMAGFVAAASQGHIGRARALATDNAVRSRRNEVLRIPLRLSSLEDAYAHAQDLKQMADEDAKSRSKSLDEAEQDELLAAYGQGATGVSAGKIKGFARSALSALSKTQTQRASRSTRDELDRFFIDLMGLYRDVLVLQTESAVGLINADLLPEIEKLSAKNDSSLTMRRIDAITAARKQLEGNVPPTLVCEALMVQLLHPVPGV